MKMSELNETLKNLDYPAKTSLKKLSLKLTFGSIIEVCCARIVDVLAGKYLPNATGVKGMGLEVGKKVAAGMAAGAVNNYIFDEIDKTFAIEPEEATE